MFNNIDGSDAIFPSQDRAIPESKIASHEINCDGGLKDWWITPPIAVVSNFSNPRRDEEQASASYQVAWLPGERENPQNWSRTCKWLVTLFYCSLVLNVTFASSAPSTACTALMHEFGLTIETSTLVTTLYLCGYIAGPIIWGPLSELVGRRPVSLGAFGAYTLWQLGTALNTQWSLLLTSRFFTGFFASAQISVCGAIIADL